MTALLVALAGGLGSVARFRLDAAIARLHSPRMPLGTLAINTLGSLILGLLTGWLLFRSGLPDWVAIAGTGFCGGFTTFSTACAEGVRLLRAGRPVACLVHAGGGLLAGLSAAAFGIWLLAL
ncbi:fluoride efflux transporter FluC [Micropruina sp.]|uniref:fluoride efflux transporter FluC n=1 Tax=Micropruina sp. TaxID=2737536 RepID=UPI0039E2D02E